MSKVHNNTHTQTHSICTTRRHFIKQKRGDVNYLQRATLLHSNEREMSETQSKSVMYAEVIILHQSSTAKYHILNAINSLDAMPCQSNRTYTFTCVPFMFSKSLFLQHTLHYILCMYIINKCWKLVILCFVCCKAFNHHTEHWIFLVYMNN